MRRSAILSILAPALVAQAPAPAPKLRDQIKAIDALKAENPLEAFEKAKALLPAAKPAFDKTNIQTASASLEEWRGILDVQTLIYNTAIEAGQFEVAKEAAEKARDMAKEMQAEAMAPYVAYRASWTKASDEANKGLARMAVLKEKEAAAKELKAKDPKGKDPKTKEAFTDQEADELATLIQNEGTFKTNISNAKIVSSQMERNLKTLDAQTKDYDKPLEQIEKRLKDEQEELMKFKGDKAKYAAALYKAVGTKPENKPAALAALRRAAFLDPANKQIPHRIDVLLGKAEELPEKPSKPAKKGGARKKGA